MKNIDTLVEDIYDLFDLKNKPSVSKTVADKILNQLGTEVQQHLHEYLYNKPKGKNNLRLSAIGKPDRQLWYDMQEDKIEKQFSSSTRIKFLYGHILESLLLALTKLAGHTVTEEQKEVEIEGVVGHQDCRIDGILVDCKSASTSSFKKFNNGTLAEDDPFGYIAQISAYAEAHNDNEAAFFVIDKQNGHLTLLKLHSMEMINAEDRVKHLKKVLLEDTVPARCYSELPDGASGNYRLPVGCVYCSHKKLCWSDSNNGQGLRAFRYAKGVRYLTKIARIPDVQEVTNV
tara:strand:+ start:3225 stop:4088 length:864 start_codon:yes stop_codon:yes gene_type:complete